jgi:uncharacterized repeat protein (TIGR01451 family)
MVWPLSNQGGTLTYTIVATNNGPSAVTGATVADLLPAELTGATWTCAASAGSACPASGTGNINATVDLLSGGTATFTLTATVERRGHHHQHRDHHGAGGRERSGRQQQRDRRHQRGRDG